MLIGATSYIQYGYILLDIKPRAKENPSRNSANQVIGAVTSHDDTSAMKTEHNGVWNFSFKI